MRAISPLDLHFVLHGPYLDRERRPEGVLPNASVRPFTCDKCGGTILGRGGMPLKAEHRKGWCVTCKLVVTYTCSAVFSNYKSRPAYKSNIIPSYSQLFKALGRQPLRFLYFPIHLVHLSSSPQQMQTGVVHISERLGLHPPFSRTPRPTALRKAVIVTHGEMSVCTVSTA